MVSARVAGIGVAHPPPVSQQVVFDGFFAGHYAGVARGLAKRVFENSGVATRHGVANPLVEDVSQWPTSRRMERYLAEALPLGKEAVSAALAEAGVAASDIGLLAVCSCTGYVTPGLDILLARDLGLPPTAQRLFVGHMGCYAALPGLGAVSDFVAVRGRPAVLLCVELPSLHVQPAAVDPQQVVAHALFSDAAAAAVLLPTTGEYGVREVASVTDTTTADYMTWQVTDLGFRMGLSPQVPDALRPHVRPLVEGMLAGHGLSVGDVGAWAVHPGGPRILDVVGEELELADDDLAASRGVLAEHGNCSSPTVLMILEKLKDRGPTPTMMLAFGPGLTLYGALVG
ncbi:type III polyketide synthase [Luedemannella flava]|uniref:Type III polyketide synthase n=1 Tax=Luedemannella flava TaxID=349316 RepID=A0ABN2ME01_9ACTN